ncbi:hypothetical protein BB561_000162 [Smittium simulii]|uniref:AB hydrolase-1 domain-containing protein n=1 Tax=Smittium simulii TaxID=133385 RepID=A0A2T9Z0I8_9FUNG|nr:hypothetical protein BB561_000162 [Smittium simulii]
MFTNYKKIPKSQRILLEKAALDWINNFKPHTRGYCYVGRCEKNINIKIYYELYGTGPIKVLFVMGTCDYWKMQVKHFLKNPKFQICIFDNRGSGKSTDYNYFYSTSDLAQDSIHLINHLGWKDNINLVGVSLGGMIVQKMCLLTGKKSQIKLNLNKNNNNDSPAYEQLNSYPSTQDMDDNSAMLKKLINVSRSKSLPNFHQSNYSNEFVSKEILTFASVTLVDTFQSSLGLLPTKKELYFALNSLSYINGNLSPLFQVVFPNDWLSQEFDFEKYFDFSKKSLGIHHKYSNEVGLAAIYYAIKKRDNTIKKKYLKSINHSPLNIVATNDFEIYLQDQKTSSSTIHKKYLEKKFKLNQKNSTLFSLTNIKDDFFKSYKYISVSRSKFYNDLESSKVCTIDKNNQAESNNTRDSQRRYSTLTMLNNNTKIPNLNIIASLKARNNDMKRGSIFQTRKSSFNFLSHKAGSLSVNLTSTKLKKKKLIKFLSFLINKNYKNLIIKKPNDISFYIKGGEKLDNQMIQKPNNIGLDTKADLSIPNIKKNASTCENSVLLEDKDIIIPKRKNSDVQNQEVFNLSTTSSLKNLTNFLSLKRDKKYKKNTLIKSQTYTEFEAISIQNTKKYKCVQDCNSKMTTSCNNHSNETKLSLNRRFLKTNSDSNLYKKVADYISSDNNKDKNRSTTFDNIQDKAESNITTDTFDETEISNLSYVSSFNKKGFFKMFSQHFTELQQFTAALTHKLTNKDIQSFKRRHPNTRFMVLGGSKDFVIRKSNFHSLAKNLECLEIIIQDAGHMGLLDSPYSVSLALESFICDSEWLRFIISEKNKYFKVLKGSNMNPILEPDKNIDNVHNNLETPNNLQDFKIFKDTPLEENDQYYLNVETSNINTRNQKDCNSISSLKDPSLKKKLITRTSSCINLSNQRFFINENSAKKSPYSKSTVTLQNMLQETSNNVCDDKDIKYTNALITVSDSPTNIIDRVFSFVKDKMASLTPTQSVNKKLDNNSFENINNESGLLKKSSSQHSKSSKNKNTESTKLTVCNKKIGKYLEKQDNIANKKILNQNDSSGLNISKDDIFESNKTYQFDKKNPEPNPKAYSRENSNNTTLNESIHILDTSQTENSNKIDSSKDAQIENTFDANKSTTNINSFVSGILSMSKQTFFGSPSIPDKSVKTAKNSESNAESNLNRLKNIVFFKSNYSNIFSTLNPTQSPSEKPKLKKQDKDFVIKYSDDLNLLIDNSIWIRMYEQENKLDDSMNEFYYDASRKFTLEALSHFK